MAFIRVDGRVMDYGRYCEEVKPGRTARMGDEFRARNAIVFMAAIGEKG